MANKNITYLNKDFTTFKNALIEYAKTYYPNSYNDFSTSSPGTMFIDMASYVGDVLSFYLDNQTQETFLEYAKQTNNLYALAYMLGYRPKVTSAAIVTLDVYQQVPASGSSGQFPDFNYAMIIEEGMQVRSNVNTSNFFYCPNRIDFNLSSSIDPTEISVYSVTGGGNPNTYLLKKKTQAISGQVKSTTLNFGTPERFPIRTIQDDNIIEILQVIDDTSGYRWYEVPYLAQDYILKPVANTALSYPQLYQEANQVPYILERIETPFRFVSRFNTQATLQLEFGAGIQAVSGSIPNPFNVGIGTVNGIDMLNTAYDPTNFVTNMSYGIAPFNTTLTVQYLTGGGAAANVGVNELTNIVTSTISFPNPTPDPASLALAQNSLAVNNSVPAIGGGDGDTPESLKLNTLAQFPSQMRAVTQQDYLGTVLGMPPKFGQVAKAYVTKDTAIFAEYQVGQPGERDPLATSLYLLGYNVDGTFTVPGTALLKNIQTYLEQYRMLTDTIILKPGYIINIQVNFDIVIRPNYTSRDVIAGCLTLLKAYFARENWQMNQPIILSEIYTLLDQIAGVQTVQKITINNIAGTNAGYSQYSYDISAATLNGVIYPSLDPSIFEVKYPDTDIQGRVVTF